MLPSHLSHPHGWPAAARARPIPRYGSIIVCYEYASHMAESPMEVILEVRYAWY